MIDTEVRERELTDAFASVTATQGVDAWRNRTPQQSHAKSIRRRFVLGIRPRLLEIGLTAGIAAALLIVSVAGTIALTHSRTSPAPSAHATSAPVAHTASPAPATAFTCSRLSSPYSRYGFTFDTPGSATPAISCSRAVATFRCPPQSENQPCEKLIGLPTTAKLERISHVGPMGEVRGRALPWVGPPFIANNLLVWEIAWVPTVCTVERNGVSGVGEVPGFEVFLAPVKSRCEFAHYYLIDANTGFFVYFDGDSVKTG